MSSSSLIGRTLGKYEIIELLGRGGMATVYKGRQADIDRFVAVKVLPPHPGQDPQFIERFQLEARTIARLQHPHILPLYDYGVQDDILYLVVAFISGGTLEDHIKEGPMPLKQIETLLRQIASAMDYAHRQNIIHRDIKPGNILLDGEGHALLADFGIVKIAGGDSRLTNTGGLVGTPAYMAPEQGTGVAVTPSVDIYALGAVVYEMITGEQPYLGDTPMQVVLKHINDPVPTLRQMQEELPPAIDRVIQRAMAKKPANRYQTAMEFAEDFSRAIQAEGQPTYNYAIPSPEPTAHMPQPVSATQTRPSESPDSQTIIMQQSVNPLVLLGGFAIIAVLIVAVVLLLVTNQNEQGVVVETAVENTQVASTLPTRAVVEPTTAPTFGRLSFSSMGGAGDTLTLQVQNLTPPGAGQVYAAWLVNTADGSILSLGELVVDSLGSGVLPPFVDPEERALPTLYNALLVTLQDDMSTEPNGTIAYSGYLPIELGPALREILIASEDGISSGSLLDGALTEAGFAAQHASLAQRASNLGGLQTHSEHTLNILYGTETDYNGDGRGENPGRKIGIPHFLDLINAQLDAVAHAPDTARDVQSNLELIRVCVENTRQRIDEIKGLEEVILAATDQAAVATQAEDAVRLAAELTTGADVNENGQIEPFEGECGLDQINTYGVLVSAIQLQQGDLRP
ncbi:MAG: protein kinase [Anaerolineaceae bacterium]|nr:protein kinase [Anaerolineaceae bacterium]